METNYISKIDCAIDYDIKDGHGVLPRYRIDPADVLQLCGGIPSKDVVFIHMEIISVTDMALNAIIHTDLYHVYRTINFGLKRISNDEMRVYEKEKHLGTNLFLNQVSFARKLGFINLTTTALEWDGHERCDGYYRWARLGYQMTDRNDLEDLRDLMRFFSRTETNLSQLVLTETGYSFWKDQGFTWTGKFDLADDSPCMSHLRQYLTLKQIAFTI
jgi:hypothetical protein